MYRDVTLLNSRRETSRSGRVRLTNRMRMLGLLGATRNLSWLVSTYMVGLCICGQSREGRRR
jgi:hypothetical protein